MPGRKKLRQIHSPSPQAIFDRGARASVHHLADPESGGPVPVLSDRDRSVIHRVIREGIDWYHACREEWPDEYAPFEASRGRDRAARFALRPDVQRYHALLIAAGIESGILEQEQFIREARALARRAEESGNYNAACRALIAAGQSAGVLANKHEVQMQISIALDWIREIDRTHGRAVALAELALAGISAPPEWREAPLAVDFAQILAAQPAGRTYDIADMESRPLDGEVAE